MRCVVKNIGKKGRTRVRSALETRRAADAKMRMRIDDAGGNPGLVKVDVVIDLGQPILWTTSSLNDALIEMDPSTVDDLLATIVASPDGSVEEEDGLRPFYEPIGFFATSDGEGGWSRSVEGGALVQALGDKVWSGRGKKIGDWVGMIDDGEKEKEREVGDPSGRGWLLSGPL